MAGGTAEVGLGSAFTPVTDGQRVDLQLGVQGLWMFVVNVRTQDLDIAPGQLGGITVGAVDQTGATLSALTACHTREFVVASDGRLELSSPYFLPMLPTVDLLDGVVLRLDVEVRDLSGHRASDHRMIVAHDPAKP